MATTKLLRIKQTGGSNKSLHLKNSIFYICNPDKTEGGMYVGGNAGMAPKAIYQEMVRNKLFWNKDTGTQGFHYMLSFSPECKVDEKLAFQIGEEFCQELLGTDFLYVIAVHNDKPHMHVHIVFDSVNRIDGLKFHSPKGDWEKRIQPISDRLCEKYHLPTLDYDPAGDRKGKSYGDWKREQKKRGEGLTWTEEQKQAVYTWRDIIRDDIDEAIAVSATYEEFLCYLGKDYIIRDNKYLSLRPRMQEAQNVLKLPGNGAVRTGRLGTGYGKEEIQARIRLQLLNPEIEKRYKTYGNREEIRAIIFTKIVQVKGWKMSPMQKQFYKRWNFTYFIRRPEYPKSWKYKKDILEIQALSDAIRYLLDFDIHTPEELKDRKKQLEQEAEALDLRLKTLRTKYSKEQPNYFLIKYERARRNYCKEADPDSKERLERQLDKLLRNIESICPYDEPVKKRELKRSEIQACKGMIYDNKQEQKLVDNIFRFFYEMEPEMGQRISGKEIETKEVEHILDEQCEEVKR